MAKVQVVPDFVGLPEAALQLGVGYQKAYTLLLGGALGHPVRRGSRWLVARAAVEALIMRQMMSSPVYAGNV